MMSRFSSRILVAPSASTLSRASLAAALTATAISAAVACSGGGQVDDTSSTSSSGGAGTTSSHSSTTATGSTTASTTGATTSSSSSGQGGSGGAPPMWPTCDTQPAGSQTKTLPEIWTDNPQAFAKEWVQGVYVIGVSGAGCAANTSCQIFVQQDLSYASFAAAQQHAIKIDILPSVAEHFTGIAVGDQVDVYGEAIRDSMGLGQELKILVTPTHPGCAKKVGSGTAVPVTATLDQLTVPVYQAQGPILVTVSNVTGHVHMLSETFGLWNTGQMPGPLSDETSVSPFFLSGGAFTGLTTDKITDFTSVTGVFGIFTPPGNIIYEEIYIRDMAEAVLK